MNVINDLFDRMDNWRHLPNYQLERRADLFFAAYLKIVLEDKFQIKFKDQLIPEFPVHIRTIYPNKDTDKSFKMDYLAIREDYSEIFLVELKTDMSSVREKQDKYLKDAADAGMTNLVKGLVEIFQVTNARRKYYHLFKTLEDLGIIELPKQLQDKTYSKNMVGVNKLIKELNVIKDIPGSRIVYIKPSGRGDNVITFREFANIIKRYDDPVSMRFIQSLEIWSTVKAGDVYIQ